MSPTVAPLPEPASAGELSTVAARRGRSLVWLKLGHAIGTSERPRHPDLEHPGACVSLDLCRYVGLARLVLCRCARGRRLQRRGTNRRGDVGPRDQRKRVRQDLHDLMRVTELHDPDIRRLVTQVITHRARMSGSG